MPLTIQLLDEGLRRSPIVIEKRIYNMTTDPEGVEYMLRIPIALNHIIVNSHSFKIPNFTNVHNPMKKATRKAKLSLIKNYEAKPKPMSSIEYKTMLEKSFQEYKQGKFITQKDLEKESKLW